MGGDARSGGTIAIPALGLITDRGEPLVTPDQPKGTDEPPGNMAATLAAAALEQDQAVPPTTQNADARFIYPWSVTLTPGRAENVIALVPACAPSRSFGVSPGFMAKWWPIAGRRVSLTAMIAKRYRLAFDMMAESPACRRQQAPGTQGTAARDQDVQVWRLRRADPALSIDLYLRHLAHRELPSAGTYFRAGSW